MKLGWLCAVAALTAAFVVVPACSSDPPAAATTADSGGDGGVTDVCASYTKIGDPCPLISGRVCFPQCATGGCKCVGSASGPRWTCTSDFSCQPDAAPDLDAGDTPPPGDDAAADAAGETDDSADAGVDAQTDAPSDAPTGG